MRAALLLLFVSLLLAGCGNPSAPAPAKALKTREEFKALVTGKTPQEVMEAIGKPDENVEGLSLTWKYGGMTYDPVTKMRDSLVIVTFRDGKVDSLSFHGRSADK